MIAEILDKVLEGPIVGSFSRVGSDVRSRAERWTSLDDYDLRDKVILLTGSTSGIGLAAAGQFAAMGATLIVNGRRPDKNERVVNELIASSQNPNVSQIAADMGDLEQVEHLAREVLEKFDRLDVLAHNAGALIAERKESPQGIEATVASQVVGPFLLTHLLLDRLEHAGDGRVLTMSSGGMYGAPLTISNLQMRSDDYNGTAQYARTKRAQVTLNEMWADHDPGSTVRFHALHPGWVDTPGVDDALPGFAKVMGPILRTPEQGADTLVWLAADDTPLRSNGKFWHDRRIRNIHKFPTTRNTDTASRRKQLWAWVSEAATVEQRGTDK